MSHNVRNKRTILKLAVKNRCSLRDSFSIAISNRRFFNAIISLFKLEALTANRRELLSLFVPLHAFLPSFPGLKHSISCYHYRRRTIFHNAGAQRSNLSNEMIMERCKGYTRLPRETEPLDQVIKAVYRTKIKTYAYLRANVGCVFRIVRIVVVVAAVMNAV